MESAKRQMMDLLSYMKKYIWGLRWTLDLSVLNSAMHFHSKEVLNKFKLWRIKHTQVSHTGNIYSIIHFHTKLQANLSMFFSIIPHPDFSVLRVLQNFILTAKACSAGVVRTDLEVLAGGEGILEASGIQEGMKCCLAVWHLWASWGFWHWKESVSPPSFSVSSNRGNMELVGMEKKSWVPPQPAQAENTWIPDTYSLHPTVRTAPTRSC